MLFNMRKLNTWDVQAMNNHEMRGKNGGCHNTTELNKILLQLVYVDPNNDKAVKILFQKFDKLYDECYPY